MYSPSSQGILSSNNSIISFLSSYVYCQYSIAAIFSLAGSARGQCVTNLRDNRYANGCCSIRYKVANFSLAGCQNTTTYIVILSEGKQIQKNLLAEVEGSTHLHYLVGQISG